MNEELLLEMAEIGRFNGYRILVYGNEGPIPHFHIDNNEKNIHACLKILEDNYFYHGNYKDKIPSNMKEDIRDFLKSPHKFFGAYGFNNWQIICVYWNDSNPTHAIKEKVETLMMPKYNNI